MERTERFYKIEQLLRARTSVPLRTFLGTLEISRATFKRDLEYLRDRMNVPIEWDAESGGYRLDPSAPRAELPGLWFSPAEAYALLTMQHLLENLQPGLLAPHVQPLLAASVGEGGLSGAALYDKNGLLQALVGSLQLPVSQHPPPFDDVRVSGEVMAVVVLFPLTVWPLPSF